MANKILVARGTKVRLEEIKSSLTANELVYATDTKELGVKKTDGNIEYFMNATDIIAEIDVLETNKQDKLVAGDNITIDPATNVISASGVDLDALPYMNYASNIYYQGGSQTLFSNGWTDHNKKTVYFDGDITFVATDSSLGFPLSFYTGAGIEELYNLMESGGITGQEAVKLTIDGVIYDATSLDSITNVGVALRYVGDVSSVQGVPTPVYGIADQENNPFMALINTTNLGMPLGKALAFINNESVNNLKIESGFNHYYENGVIIPDGVEVVPLYALFANSLDPIKDDFLKNANIPLVIPNSVTSIGYRAFSDWISNNQPLVIPNSVTSIGVEAFDGWISNNQPLVIGNSVTSIGNVAFDGWISNNQPLVIGNSVTSIGSSAFRDWTQVPYIVMESLTPPTLSSANAFSDQNNAPIYVPDSAVAAYKNATNWSALASRIFSINEK